MAAVLAERFDYGFEFDNLFGTYFQVRNVGEFDTVTITERAASRSSGPPAVATSTRPSSRPSASTSPGTRSASTSSEFADKLRANYAETIEELVTLAEQRLDAEVNRRMFQMLQDGDPVDEPVLRQRHHGSDKGQLDAAITRRLPDAIKPNGAGQPPMTILGRAAMVDKISDVVTDAAALFDPEAYRRDPSPGRLGVYRGANVSGSTTTPTRTTPPTSRPTSCGSSVAGRRVRQVRRHADQVLGREHRGLPALPWPHGHRRPGYRPEQARRIVDGTVTP